MKVTRRSEFSSEWIKIENKAGLEVLLCDFGASVYEIRIHGKAMNLAPKDKKEFLNAPAYFGKTIGRIAGRLENATLPWRGKVYKMTPNEGKTSLHGGPTGFSYRHFACEVAEGKDEVKVFFKYHSPDGEEGYPGNLDVTVTYVIKEESLDLDMLYEAASDVDTPLSLTNHLYFNLGEFDTIRDHKMTIKASQVENMDNILIPLGPIPVSKLLDFRGGKTVAPDVDHPSLANERAGGFDHIFIFDETKGEPNAILESKTHKMEVYTNCPSIVVYSSNYTNPDMDTNIGKKQIKHSAITMECAEYPLDFERMCVHAGKKWTRYVTLKFFKLGEQK